MSVCQVAVQAVLPKEKVSSGTSVVIFARALGGSVCLSIGQNVLDQDLAAGLRRTLPQLNPDIFSDSGATNLIGNVEKAGSGNLEIVQMVLDLYNYALTRTFLVALVVACLTVIPLLGMELEESEKEMRRKSVHRGQKR